MASFPTSIWSPTTKNTNDVIQPAHVNDAQSEIVAIETAALTATSFTPSLKFGGASVGVAYSQQVGSCVKVGKLTVAEVALTLTSKGTSTGAATITGLPATVAGAGPVCLVDLVASFAGLTGAVYGSIGGTTINLLQTSTGARVNVTDANFMDASNIRASIVYIAT